MEIIYWDSLNEESRQDILARSQSDIESVVSDVETIVERVHTHGDAACREYTLQFDGIDLGHRDLTVGREEFEMAASSLPQSVKLAITRAIENVRRFHEEQLERGFAFVESAPGIFAAERTTPIPRVGLYVPRGRGSFPSMLYMLAVPAVIAGVPELSVATPPLPDGTVDPACLYAAELCGVETVYRIGGAVAVAAFAYGTETVRPVEKIIGPGNIYVTAAKRVVYGTIDVGLPAGPTESVILADETASPWKLALDLTIEAEHGSDSQALLITHDGAQAARVIEHMPQLIEDLPEPRRSFVSDVLSGYGGVIVTTSIEQSIELVNQIAPEHLSIQTQDPFSELPLIKHAGEILLGEHTPFSLANYAAGANAVLPTGGNARTYSPVSVRDFMKYTSIVYATARGLEGASETVASLADYEGFPAHARAIRRRAGE